MYITIKNNLISVYSLKKEIGIDDINVYFNGKQLEDNRTLFEYNIKKNDRVEVVKKNRGGRLTGGQIFGYVILLFVYMGILLSGLIPFISFIMSNIIIKSLVIGVDFVKGLLDEDNWLYNFMDFVKESCIPIIRFIFDFGIISIAMYFLTFACVYQLYKEKWGPANIFQAFRNCSTLSMFMMMFMTLFYALANSPTFIERILTPFFPSFLGGALRTCCNILNRVRNFFIRMMPFSGMMVMVADLLTIAISMMSDYSYLIEDSLKNYIEFYKMFMTNMEYKIMSEKYGFKPILDLLFRVEKFEKGEYDLSTNTIPNKRLEGTLKTILQKETSRKDTAYAYMTRSIYQSILYVFSKVVFIFDICNATDQEKELVNENIGSIDSHLTDIQRYITEIKEKQYEANPVLKNIDGNAFKEKLEKAEKVIEYYKTITGNLKAGEEGRTKMVVVDCIFTILENGVATAFPMTLLFIIFFLIFMFVPVGF
jgi:hypothetical protein